MAGDVKSQTFFLVAQTYFLIPFGNIRIIDLFKGIENLLPGGRCILLNSYGFRFYLAIHTGDALKIGKLVLNRHGAMTTGNIWDRKSVFIHG